MFVVIGVYEGHLWVHVDDDHGATYWDNIQGPEDLQKLGFTRVDDDEDNTSESVMGETINYSVITLSDERNVAVNLGDLRSEHLFEDIWLLVGPEQKKFGAHKAILWARSNVFRSMFSYNMKECRLDRISLPQVNSSVFDDVLKYLYRGEISTTCDLGDLLEVSIFLGITSLYDNLVDTMKRGISLSNVIPLLELSMKFSVTPLRDECQKYITHHAIMVIDKNMEILSQEALEFIVKQNQLRHMTEEDVLTTILKWSRRVEPVSKRQDCFRHFLRWVNLETIVWERIEFNIPSSLELSDEQLQEIKLLHEEVVNIWKKHAWHVCTLKCTCQPKYRGFNFHVRPAEITEIVSKYCDRTQFKM